MKCKECGKPLKITKDRETIECPHCKAKFSIIRSGFSDDIIELQSYEDKPPSLGKEMEYTKLRIKALERERENIRKKYSEDPSGETTIVDAICKLFSKSPEPSEKKITDRMDIKQMEEIDEMLKELKARLGEMEEYFKSIPAPPPPGF